MTFICKYCQNSFKNMSILNYHIKTAKYCLQLRDQLGKFVCQYCQKNLSDKRNLNLHEEKCNSSNINLKLISLERDLENAKNTIKDKDKQIEKLQNQLHEIALNASLKTTNNTNVINLSPITKDWLDSQSINLNKYHLQNGAHGYADFAINYSLKDRVKCTDFSRNIFHYIDENGMKIREKGHNLCKMFFSSIKEKIEELFKQQKNDLYRLIDTATEEETCELFKLINEYTENNVGIARIVRGEHDKLRDEFIKELATRLAKTLT
jgi:hypothetical protein